MSSRVSFVRLRSEAYVWWREYRFGGFRWANHRMWGARFGR